MTDIWGELEPGTAKTLLGFLRKFVVSPTPLLYHVFFAIIGIAIWGVHPTFRHIPFTQQNAAYSVVETVCAKVWAGSMLRGVQREKRCAVKSTFIVTKGEYLWFLK